MNNIKLNTVGIDLLWHDVNIGDDYPKEYGIFLIITHNGDYGIAQYAFKDDILDKDMNWIGDNLPDISHALIANEDGFYTVSPVDGKKKEIKRIHVTAWAILPDPRCVLKRIANNK